jgi:hypothetical protein
MTIFPEHLVVVQSRVDFFVGDVDLEPARSTTQREEEPTGCLRRLA